MRVRRNGRNVRFFFGKGIFCYIIFVFFFRIPHLPFLPLPSSSTLPLYSSTLPHATPQHPIRTFQVSHHALQALEQRARLLPLRRDVARQRFVLGLRLGDLADELCVRGGEVGSQVGKIERGGGEGVRSVGICESGQGWGV